MKRLAFGTINEILSFNTYDYYYYYTYTSCLRAHGPQKIQKRMVISNLFGISCSCQNFIIYI